MEEKTPESAVPSQERFVWELLDHVDSTRREVLAEASPESQQSVLPRIEDIYKLIHEAADDPEIIRVTQIQVEITQVHRMEADAYTMLNKIKGTPHDEFASEAYKRATEKISEVDERLVQLRQELRNPSATV